MTYRNPNTRNKGRKKRQRTNRAVEHRVRQARAEVCSRCEGDHNDIECPYPRPKVRNHHY